MKTIWKYKIGLRTKLEIPEGFTPIHAGRDPNGDECLWCIVNPNRANVLAVVSIYMTGEELPYQVGNHVGSFESDGFMLHVFIETFPRP